MSSKIWHVLGNGDRAVYYNEKPRPGKLLLCNMPPFNPPVKPYATCMVDFKMMMALNEGSVQLNKYDWILGTRPRIWMYEQSQFYLKYAHCVKEFYTHVPEYAYNPTNFNCGHMAVHYAAAQKKAEEVHLYGFDTIFDFNMRSSTDLALSSDRGNLNNYRLLNIWRPIWRDIFREFPSTKFILHHNHDKLKVPVLDNMHVEVYNDGLSSAQRVQDESDISDGRGMDQQQVNPGEQAPMNRATRRRLEAIERKQKGIRTR